MKNNKEIIYQRLISMVRASGCHQMPERSFFIRGKQFPVCARCTGVLIGNLIAYVMFFIYQLPPDLCVIGCAIMLTDWFVQYIGIRKSTNVRRLITGIIGGFSLATLYCLLIKNTIEMILFTLQIGGIK